MRELHKEYPKEHLKYAKWLAYGDELNHQRLGLRSYSDEIVWNLLSEANKTDWLKKAEIGFSVYLHFTLEMYLNSFAVTWKCPVCGLLSEDAPTNDHICPECKTHFDYEDCAETVEGKKKRHKALKKAYYESINKMNKAGDD